MTASVATDLDYVALFDKAIEKLFRDALRLCLKHPKMAPFLYHTMRAQRKAALIRGDWQERGVRVPAFMIASITKKCNLACKGCYARAQHRGPEAEMSPAKLRALVDEASELGISIILVAGGEPLTRPEILDIAADHPEVIFPVFTNGLLITPEVVAKLKDARNIVPVISLEGHMSSTDERRGAGVYAYLRGVMAQLDKAGIFFGTSITLNRTNYDEVLARGYVQGLLDAGSRLVFYIDYVPVQPGTEGLVLTDEQLEREMDIILGLQEDLPGLFIAFPGGEEEFGGCLAAGRGFVHVSPEGRVEPCPFSPFSDISLDDGSLLDALQSELLRTIRENAHLLEEGNGGCALWEKREWVASLVHDAT